MTHNLCFVTVLTLGSTVGLNPVVGFACTSSGMPVDRPAHATLRLRMRAADAHHAVCGSAQVWMMERPLCPKNTSQSGATAVAVVVTVAVCVQVPDAHQQPRRALARWLPLAVLASLPADSTLAAPYPQDKTEEEWSKFLSEQQKFILRDGGTEPPNSSPLVRERRSGVYKCAGCSASLFQSNLKFEARTGWPTFGDAVQQQVHVSKVAPSFLETLTGAECRCANCGGRLGERFLDGASFPGSPAARTGKRYSINGAALVFEPEEGPAVSGDAYPTVAGKRLKFDWKMRDGGLRSI